LLIASAKKRGEARRPKRRAEPRQEADPPRRPEHHHDEQGRDEQRDRKVVRLDGAEPARLGPARAAREGGEERSERPDVGPRLVEDEVGMGGARRRGARMDERLFERDVRRLAGVQQPLAVGDLADGLVEGRTVMGQQRDRDDQPGGGDRETRDPGAAPPGAGVPRRRLRLGGGRHRGGM
jgi:hypothetical protein